MVRVSHTTRAVLVFVAATLCVAACRPDSAEPRPSSPSRAEDSSCHNSRNLFLNGAKTIHAIFRIDLKASNDDWAELTRLFQAFADSHEGWSLRDSSESRAGVVKTLYLSLCTANQPNIEVGEQRWAWNDYAPLPTRGIGIRFYGDVTEAVWHPVAVEFVAMLEARWPSGVRFLNGGGYSIDRPEFLGEPAAPPQQ